MTGKKLTYLTIALIVFIISLAFVPKPEETKAKPKLDRPVLKQIVDDPQAEKLEYRKAVIAQEKYEFELAKKKQQELETQKKASLSRKSNTNKTTSTPKNTSGNNWGEHWDRTKIYNTIYSIAISKGQPEDKAKYIANWGASIASKESGGWTARPSIGSGTFVGLFQMSSGWGSGRADGYSSCAMFVNSWIKGGDAAIRRNWPNTH